MSSPDGLGDFILRIPMLHALLDAGHELQLFLRPPANELARELFPEVEQHMISCDPYYSEVKKKKNPFGREHSFIRAFSPDLYLAAPFSLSYFDQVWIESGDKQIPVMGFFTKDPLWPTNTTCDPALLARAFSPAVQVPLTMPDLEKNRMMTEALLGKSMPAKPPIIIPSEENVSHARQVLAKYGVTESGYWVACVGTRSGLEMKDWGEKHWINFFSETSGRDGKPILFLGSTKESDSIERIRSAITSRVITVNLAANNSPLLLSLGLIALSHGYLGRDSGVMHLASALGRRVLAVYSGAHWGRFLPSAGPAVVVTQAVSCRNCNFACIQERPLCVQDIIEAVMLSAWEQLHDESGVITIEQEPATSGHTIPSEQVCSQILSLTNDRRSAAGSPRQASWFFKIFRFFQQ